MPKGKPLQTDEAGSNWTTVQDGKLLDLWLGERPLKPLATELGRTVKALERRIWALATCYRGLMYADNGSHAVVRVSRAGAPNTRRDQEIIALVKKHAGLGKGVDLNYIAMLLARTREEIEEMTGRKDKEMGDGFGF